MFSDEEIGAAAKNPISAAEACRMLMGRKVAIVDDSNVCQMMANRLVSDFGKNYRIYM